MKQTNNARKHTNDAAFQDLREAVSTLRTANDAISVLVSALTYQATARTMNQRSCDYCGEAYEESARWYGHLTIATFCLRRKQSSPECVQHLLRERAITKHEIEGYLATQHSLRGAM